MKEKKREDTIKFPSKWAEITELERMERIAQAMRRGIEECRNEHIERIKRQARKNYD